MNCNFSIKNPKSLQFCAKQILPPNHRFKPSYYYYKSNKNYKIILEIETNSGNPVKTFNGKFIFLQSFAIQSVFLFKSISTKLKNLKKTFI